MQELRLVAVSEDGTYLVLATAGRGTGFTLPVDDRLRAALRGPLLPPRPVRDRSGESLAPQGDPGRIRSGETAEEIAESAGIPVERVRWFEGPVLQEREYMAQQAQRVSVRRPGESTPGPPLGETVEERLGRGGVDLEESGWDSWKCEDGTWRVRLSFFEGGRPHAAEWTFDPRHRVSPLDEIAARLTSVEWDDDALSDTVTPLVPRRPAMKVVGSDRDYPTETTPARRPARRTPRKHVRPARRHGRPPQRRPRARGTGHRRRPARRDAATDRPAVQRARNRDRHAQAARPPAGTERPTARRVRKRAQPVHHKRTPRRHHTSPRKRAERDRHDRTAQPPAGPGHPVAGRVRRRRNTRNRA